jgi:hypothetical protein
MAAKNSNRSTWIVAIVGIVILGVAAFELTRSPGAVAPLGSIPAAETHDSARTPGELGKIEARRESAAADPNDSRLDTRSDAKDHQYSEKLRRSKRDQVLGLARGATPHDEDPIDVLLADPYWNPRKMALDAIDREALRKVLAEKRVECEREEANYRQVLARNGTQAIEEGRYSAFETDAKGKPVLGSTGPQPVIYTGTTKDGRMVRVDLDPAKLPEVREATSSLDSVKSQLSDAVLTFLDTHGLAAK